MKFNYYDINNIKNYFFNNNKSIQKKFGQNFLIKEKIIDDLIKINQISNKDLVIEIGCGLGNITNKILDIGTIVIGFEIDRFLISHLKEIFNTYKNFILIEGDFLKKYKLIPDILKNFFYERIIFLGAIPYYITSDIIETILINFNDFELISFIIQYDLKDKIFAKQGTKKYNEFSILINYFTNPVIITEIKSYNFFPEPSVNSMLINLNNKKNNSVFDKKIFINLVKSIFLNRRKQIKNNIILSPYLKNINHEILIDCLKKSNIDLNKRGEELSIEKIIELANNISKSM